MDIADFLFVARTVASLALIVAGAAKLIGHGDRLRAAISNYGRLPAALSRPIAALLPPLEVGSGVLLLTGFLMPVPALFAMVLFGTFAGAMGFNLVRGRRFPCSCYGVAADDTISWFHVVEDVVLAGLAVIATGLPWSATWRWPFSVAPDGADLSRPQLWGNLSIAVGFVVAVVALRAVITVFDLRRTGVARGLGAPPSERSGTEGRKAIA